MSENPYSAPNANLETSTPAKRGWGWKLYFGFMILLTLLGFLGFASMENAGFPEIISIALTIPAFLAFYGYVYSKKIFTREVWPVNFAIQLAWGIAYYFVTDADLSAGMDSTTFLVSQGIVWIISIPYYLALLLYGFKSNPLWDDEKA